MHTTVRFWQQNVIAHSLGTQRAARGGQIVAGRAPRVEMARVEMSFAFRSRFVSLHPWRHTAFLPCAVVPWLFVIATRLAAPSPRLCCLSGAASAVMNVPNQSLYLQNLNEKTKKQGARRGGARRVARRLTRRARAQARVVSVLLRLWPRARRRLPEDAQAQGSGVGCVCGRAISN